MRGRAHRSDDCFFGPADVKNLQMPAANAEANQGRTAGLKTLPRIFTILWKAAPKLMIGSMSLRIASAVLPLGVLFVSKRIIDLLVNRRGAASTLLWELLAAEFVLVICASSTGRATDYCDA